MNGPYISTCLITIYVYEPAHEISVLGSLRFCFLYLDKERLAHPLLMLNPIWVFIDMGRFHYVAFIS